MSVTETAGAHLARLRIQFGERWRIDRDEDGYVARDRNSRRRPIRADSPGELESKLIEQAGR